MAQSKLVSSIRTEIRRRNYSYGLEQAYIRWIIRFVYYHELKHPRNLGEKEVERFLNYLAMERIIPAHALEQARNAIRFYYKHVLRKPLPKLGEMIFAEDPSMCKDLVKAAANRG